jgi:hypothetical protein
MQLDLSNASHLDSGVTEKFSNFRLAGIGKPSAKQVARWTAKGKTAKIERLTAKGKIAPTASGTTTTSDGSTASGATTASDGSTASGATTASDGSATSGATTDLGATDSSDKILGMPKKTAMLVGGLLLGGVVLYFVTKSRGVRPALAAA